jgi:hypothetical protein
MAQDQTIHSLFCIPQILTRASSIEVQQLRSMVSTGVTLAAIYPNSFRETPEEVLTLCEEIAYQMYLYDL